MRFFVILFLFLLAPAAHSETIFVRSQGPGASIEIDAGRREPRRIPRTIYGTFLEPIGKAIYGGLWAQVLENPSFEGGLWSASYIRREIDREPALERASQLGLPFPWEPLDYAQGSRYEPRWSESANAARSLLVMGLPSGETGVRQKVYLPAHRILRYTGSLHARHVSGPSELEVSVRGRNHTEEILAKASISLRGNSWSRYEFSLELARGKLARLDSADFVVAVRNETRVVLDQVFLFPADHVEGMEPEMVEMIRALKSPLMRFGGNFTSGYHWRDAIGPLDRRIPMLNQAWGIPEYNHFGTDEFLRFCRLTGAEPQICLNLGSGTPEEAAAWVKYVNERWNANKGGLLWELGNELWGKFQIGYPTIERIADRTKAFSAAVRSVDPNARLIATGGDPDRFRDWNAEQLKLPPELFHFLATHFVVGTGNVRRPDATPRFIAESSLALPVGLERLLREMKSQIDATPGAADRMKIAFTEWLFHGGDDHVPRFTNLGGALITAGFLNTLIRVSDFTPISDMTGTIEFGGLWKKRGQVYGVPAYWAFRMYSTADAAVPVEARVSSPGYDVEQGNNRISEIRDIPYLDVVAALNEAGDRLTLFCVNRHIERDIETRIRVSSFSPAAQARVQTLAAISIYQPNDEVRPLAVRPVESVIPVAGVEFAYPFPRSSVTVMELRAK